MHKLVFISVFIIANSALASTQVVTLSVPDMNCAARPITVKKALSKVDGVGKIIVSLEKHEAEVSFDDTKTSVKN